MTLRGYGHNQQFQQKAIWRRSWRKTAISGIMEGCGRQAEKYLAHCCGQEFSLRRPGNPFSGPVVLRHRVAPVLLFSESAFNFNDKG
jgi:hypothetical protein